MLCLFEKQRDVINEKMNLQMEKTTLAFEIPSCNTMEMMCYAYDLEGTEVFELLSEEEKICIWNGFGPDRFPKWLRELLSLKESVILPACYIHDLDYGVGGSKKYFYKANRRFRKNACKCIDRCAGRFSFFYRQLLKVKIKIMEVLCNWLGYKGWNKKK